MKILTQQEVKDRKNVSFEREILASNGWSEDKYDILNIKPLKPGDIFLYEKISLSNISSTYENITYPKLAVYLDAYAADQNLEIEYKNIRRTWEYKTEYEYEYNGKTYTNIVADIRDIEYTILWNETIRVFGVWDNIPNWKELKKAYKKTNWFKNSIEKERDLKINTLLRR